MTEINFAPLNQVYFNESSIIVIETIKATRI